MQKTNPKSFTARADEEQAWDIEIEAVKSIKEGKTKMVSQSSEEFLAELRELENKWMKESNIKYTIN